MIADALRRGVVLLTPEQALLAAVAAAHKRFVIGGRVVHMDGQQRGTLREILVDDGEVKLIIIGDDNRRRVERPGYWSRSSL